MGSFILRLRECHSRWQVKEPVKGGEDDGDALRSQLVAGGPAKRELQRLIRRAHRLTFAEACKEAKEVEEEDGSVRDAEVAETRRTMAPVSNSAPEPAPPAPVDAMAWRQTMREEMRLEIGEQMRELRETLLAELRSPAEKVAPPA